MIPIPPPCGLEKDIPLKPKGSLLKPEDALLQPKSYSQHFNSCCHQWFQFCEDAFFF